MDVETGPAKLGDIEAAVDNMPVSTGVYPIQACGLIYICLGL